MNAMIYIRGNRHDYDAWAKAGATGWSYDEVLPLFKRTEKNSRGANHYHGVDGRNTSRTSATRPNSPTR